MFKETYGTKYQNTTDREKTRTKAIHKKVFNGFKNIEMAFVDLQFTPKIS